MIDLEDKSLYLYSNQQQTGCFFHNVSVHDGYPIFKNKEFAQLTFFFHLHGFKLSYHVADVHY